MSKKRAIVSYEKLSIDQKKQLILDFPDGFSSGMTTIKTPTGETLEALLWEVEEVIYLVKLNKPLSKAKSVDEEDEEDEDDLPKFEDVKGDDDENFDDDEDEDYDVADEEDEGEEPEEEEA